MRRCRGLRRGSDVMWNDEGGWGCTIGMEGV